MNSWKTFCEAMANNKLVQLLAAVPFAACVILDLTYDLTISAPQWVNWAVVAYSLIVMHFFRKQVDQLGSLMIMWTVLGAAILLILGASMHWGHLFSLLPAGFVVTHIEMFLLLDRPTKNEASEK